MNCEKRGKCTGNIDFPRCTLYIIATKRERNAEESAVLLVSRWAVPAYQIRSISFMGSRETFFSVRTVLHGLAVSVLRKAAI